MKKNALTHLQIEKLGMSLKESKKNVDLLLDNNKIVLEVDSSVLAELFIEESERIGVSCKLIT